MTIVRKEKIHFIVLTVTLCMTTLWLLQFPWYQCCTSRKQTIKISRQNPIQNIGYIPKTLETNMKICMQNKHKYHIANGKTYTEESNTKSTLFYFANMCTPYLPCCWFKCTKDVAISTSPLSGSSCLDCRNFFDIYFEQRSKLIMTL